MGSELGRSTGWKHRTVPIPTDPWAYGGPSWYDEEVDEYQHQTRALVAGLGQGFKSNKAEVNGTTLHFVSGGEGPPIVLLHGFPQDWYEWRHVLLPLARSATVVAVDQRGVGGSAPSTSGYEAVNLAEDVYQLTQQLGLEQVYVAGHDVGGWVAYALARRHPEALRGVMVLETPVPGIEPWLNLDIDVPLWHGAFHMIPDLPEALVAGRQAIYFRHFFDVGLVDRAAISEADVEHYAGAYRDPGHLRAAFEPYRAIPANMAFNVGERTAIDVPLLLAGAEHVFGPVLSELADRLRAEHGWADVKVEVLDGARHYLVEDRPEVVTRLIERCAS
jgi:pimeloyl-ACP methyl ester carboxylesterase